MKVKKYIAKIWQKNRKELIEIEFQARCYKEAVNHLRALKIEYFYVHMRLF